MSNLSSSVKFDVLRGWPNGSAVAESYAVTATKTVKEGQFVQIAGTANAPTVAVQAAVLVTAKSQCVIQGNDQFDGSFTRKCVALRGTFTIKTEKFVPTSQTGVTAYVPGTPLTVVGGTGTYAGCLCSATNVTGAAVNTDLSTGAIVGYVDSYDATNGVMVVNVDC